jgi:hypothetical protein
MLKMAKLNCEKGQSIFEFVVFLPFFLILITILVTMGGAINGSINQLKATRGYFYYIVKNNSNIPPSEDVEPLEGLVSAIGMYSIGWRDGSRGSTPLGPCYKIISLAGGDKKKEICSDKVSQLDRVSTFVKVFTVYGLCSTSYAIGPSGKLEINHLIDASISGDCSIR